MEKTNIYDTMIRIGFLAFIITWCVMILFPFIQILLWGVIFAITLNPLHRSLTKRLGGRGKIALLILVLACLAIIFIPGWFLLDASLGTFREMKESLDAGTLAIPAPAEQVRDWPVIGEKVYALWNSASTNMGLFIATHEDQVVAIGKTLVEGILNATSGLFQMFISLIIAGVLLVTGEAGNSSRKIFKRLAGEMGDELAASIEKTINSVVKGVLGVAFFQSLLIGIGFLLAGIPYAGVWTLLILFLTILQLPPTVMVVPAIIYLFSSTGTVPAVLWTIYLVMAAISDNVLKPLVLGKGAPVPMLVIFLGVIGGFMLSGFIGLFTGAIVMSLGYKLFLMWMNVGTKVQQDGPEKAE
jgi:predicted PurR-regulated permease PerM